jgi:hypothetical protein
VNEEYINATGCLNTIVYNKTNTMKIHKKFNYSKHPTTFGRAPLKKLIITTHLKRLRIFYGTQRFIVTLLTIAYHWTLS